ncbi:MAG TPA: hypothetical protein VG253_14645 [Streptosporangiaceae bacterium]|nr:hypothetical protein [Streptosporangiaceae bacterium]
MKPRGTAETAIICATGLIALGLVVASLQVTHTTGKSLVLIVLAAAIGAGLVALSRYHFAKRRTQGEVASDEQYRRLAEEYRRLSDLAITAQEHTDLKLGDVSAQLDHLREQTESLQKILKEVE